MPEACDDRHLTLELVSALCARLCHDVSSPLGTLSGTLELAAEQPEDAPEALAIANEASALLVARLQLMRAAWAGDCGPMGRVRLGELAAGLPPRVRVDLAGLGDAEFDGEVARVLLNLLLLGADALPSGGAVSLAGALPAGVMVMVAGRAAGWPAGLAPALSDPAAVRAEPRTVQIPLTVLLVRTAGLHLSFAPATGPSAPSSQGVPGLLLTRR